MKWLFVEPTAPGFHIYSKVHLPRLGTLILAEIVKTLGHKAEVFIEGRTAIDPKLFAEFDAIGISTTTSTAPRAYWLAEHAKQLGKLVILGGAHVSFKPDEALDHVNFVVRGEGERAIRSFITQWTNGRDWSLVPNLSFREDGTVQHNQIQEPIHELDELPVLNLATYRNQLRGITGGVIYPVQISRGCPFDCTFCTVTKMFGRRYRTRSVEHVLAELTHYDHARSFVFFNDDNFAEDRDRTVELLRAMIRSKFRFKWSTQVRASVARDIELVRIMKQAGCHTVYVGFESINPDSLAAMRKKQSVEDIDRAVRVFHRVGIAIHGMFIFGLDSDTKESLTATVAQATKWNIDSVQFMVLTPMPGSETYDTLCQQQRLLFTDWSLFDAHHVVFMPKTMNPLELQLMQILAHERFYSKLSIAKRLITGKFHNMAISTYARRLNHAWERMNRDWLDRLAKVS